MKIAINTRFLIKNKMEGFGRFTLEVLKELVEQHPEHEFFFLFDRPYSEEFIFGKNVTPVVLFPPARHPILWYLWFEWAVPRALNKIKPDIFFSPDSYLSLRASVKTLMICHDISFIHYPDKIPKLVGAYYRYYTPKFLKRADRLSTLSNHSRKDISDYYNIPTNKIDLTHASSHGDFQPISDKEKEVTKKKYSEGADYFLYVGSINPRKNVSRLLKAFELFKEQSGSSMKLLLIGKFMFKKDDVQTIYEKSKFRKDILFLGYMNDELFKITASAFAVTYVSLYEGFGMPIVEALFCHVPVITSNVSSMPEVVGDAGLTVDPTIINDISKAMNRLFNDKELYHSLVAKCIIRKKKYTWGTAAQKIYTSMLKTLETDLA